VLSAYGSVMILCQSPRGALLVSILSFSFLIFVLICSNHENWPLNTPIHAHLFQQDTVTRKVGHTDLVFGAQSGFISRSVHTRPQVSVCSGYDLFHPG